MSLTSFLTDPNHKALRNKLRSEFLRPTFNLKNEIIAPPLTKNYGIIGTAFDYLFRFFIQYHNKEKKIYSRPWLAEKSLKQLEKKISEGLLSNLRIRYTRANISYETFLKNGIADNDLFADCLFLAKIDLYFRAGIIAEDLLEENNLDISDLKNLYTIIDISNFKINSHSFLNPTFGIGSNMVGGADADLILDDTLVEVKVSRYLKLEREHLNQLIGYYTLALIGGINNKHKASLIKNVGVYFARHGVLWTLPISEFGNAKKFRSFKDWFISYFNELKQENTSSRKPIHISSK